MKLELFEARSKLEALEARVTDAENDAEAKAEEVGVCSFKIHPVKYISFIV